MIINDLHFVCVIAPPRKTNPPPLIDAHALLALTVSSQLLQVIRWQHLEVNEGASIVQHSQLPICNLLDIRGQGARELALQYLLPRFPMLD
jgi:hypothetical protein